MENSEALVFRQLFDAATSTYTYLLGDRASGEALLIDPVFEKVDRDLTLLGELGLKLSWVVDTHVHADHVTGAGDLRQRTGARTAVSAKADVTCADRALREGDTLEFGSRRLRVLETPGHTDGCLSLVGEGRVFTGDSLTIRGAGRTDFQQGSPERLYDSITGKLFSLPDETLVYPGHDYRGCGFSTIGEEKRFNPRIGGGRSREDFAQIMRNLKLDAPKLIAIAVPANLNCGKG